MPCTDRLGARRVIRRVPVSSRCQVGAVEMALGDRAAWRGAVWRRHAVTAAECLRESQCRAGGSASARVSSTASAGGGPHRVAEDHIMRFTRRHFIAAAATCALGTAGSSPARAADRPSTVTQWQLNPSWGHPLSTATGSDTKTRCRGRACHLAAPHRYFLTEADAVAGRLHPCCLAQPVPVTVCIDLNELMPYYRARLGGVDARCPELPDHLRSALTTVARCPVVSDDPSEDASPPGESQPPDEADRAGPTAATTPASATGAELAGSIAAPLPTTGSEATGPLLAASAMVAAGCLLAGATDRSSARSTTDLADAEPPS